MTAAAMSIATRAPVDAGRDLAEQVLAMIDPEDCPTPVGNNVLIALYTRSKEKDLGDGKKLFFADRTIDDDVYQGMIGLVVALGHDAYLSDANRTFGHAWCKRGDWVQFPLYEAQPRRFKFHGLTLAYIQDADVMGVVQDPRTVA